MRKLPSSVQFKVEGIVGIPNEVFPSDHLPIAAVFEYGESKKFVIDDQEDQLL